MPIRQLISMFRRHSDIYALFFCHRSAAAYFPPFSAFAAADAAAACCRCRMMLRICRAMIFRDDDAAATIT